MENGRVCHGLGFESPVLLFVTPHLRMVKPEGPARGCYPRGARKGARFESSPIRFPPPPRVAAR